MYKLFIIDEYQEFVNVVVLILFKSKLTDLKFYDSKLSFSFVIPEIGDNPLKAWLNVDGDILEGPLGGDDDGMATDYPMKGNRINLNEE